MKVQQENTRCVEMRDRSLQNVRYSWLNRKYGWARGSLAAGRSRRQSIYGCASSFNIVTIHWERRLFAVMETFHQPHSPQDNDKATFLLDRQCFTRRESRGHDIHHMVSQELQRCEPSASEVSAHSTIVCFLEDYGTQSKPNGQPIMVVRTFAAGSRRVRAPCRRNAPYTHLSSIYIYSSTRSEDQVLKFLGRCWRVVYGLDMLR